MHSRPRLAGAIFSTIASQGGITAVRLLSTGLLARLVQPDGFGTVAIAVTLTGLIGLIFEVGLGQALVQRNGPISDDVRAVAFTITLVGALLCFLIVSLVAPTLASILSDSHLPGAVLLLSLGFLARPAGLIGEAELFREARFKLVAFIDAAAFLIATLLVALPMAWLSLGYWSLVCAALIEGVIRNISYAAAAKRRPRLGSKFGLAKSLLSFGIPLTLARITNFAAIQGDNLVVGKLLGLSALGYYSRAYALASQPANLVGVAILRVLFPSMARIQSDVPLLRREYLRALSMAMLIAMPASVILAIFAGPMTRVILGQAWHPAAAALALLSSALFARVGYKLCEVIVTARGAVKALAVCQGLYALYVVTGAALGSILFGLEGAAAGVALGTIANYVTMSFLARRVTAANFTSFAVSHGAGVKASLYVVLMLGISRLACDALELPPLAGKLVEVALAIAAVVVVIACPRTLLGRRDSLPVGRLIRSLRTLSARSK